MSNAEPHAEVVALLRKDNSLVTSNDDIKDSEQFYRVVINIGDEAGMGKSTKVLIYTYGEEIFDPKSSSSLGFFELVKGEGSVVQTQAMMSVVKCSQKRTTMRKKPSSVFSAAARGLGELDYEQVVIEAPFDDVKIGDYVRLV